MTAKLKNTPQPWIDPDDAPELTDELFEKTVWMIGDREISPDEGKVAFATPPYTVAAQKPSRPSRH